MAQEWAKKFYRSRRWQMCRAEYIARRVGVDGGLCELCRDAPGYIVHHKQWLTPDNITDPDVSLSASNLLYVCKRCHDAIDRDDGVLYGFDDAGNPVPVAERRA